MTVPALFFALIVGRTAQYTTDQTMVLRIQSTRSTDDARRAFIVNAAGDALWMLGLTFVGLALFAYFQHKPPPEGLAVRSHAAVLHVEGVPGGSGGPGHRGDSRRVALERRCRDSLGSSVLVVDIYNRLIMGRRDGSRRGRSSGGGCQRTIAPRCALRMATVLVGVLGTTLATQCRGHRQPARNRQQADQLVRGPAVRHLPAGDVQHARDQHGGAGGWRGRRDRRVPRRVSQLDRVPVAVHLRTDRHGDRRCRMVADVEPAARRDREPHLARRHAAISGLTPRSTCPSRIPRTSRAGRRNVVLVGRLTISGVNRTRRTFVSLRGLVQAVAVRFPVGSRAWSVVRRREPHRAQRRYRRRTRSPVAPCSWPPRCGDSCRCPLSFLWSYRSATEETG